MAIQQVLNSWGPAVDSGNSVAAAALFAEDGFVQTDRSHMGGPSGVSEMVEGDGHDGVDPPRVRSHPGLSDSEGGGDRADATGYSRVYLHSEDGWKVFPVLGQPLAVSAYQQRLEGRQPSRITSSTVDPRRWPYLAVRSTKILNTDS